MKINFPVQLSEIYISIETGPCFGPCPIYHLTISGTGDVVFEGRNFVASEGVQTRQISPDKVKDLIAAAFEIGFFEMANHYNSERIFEILPDNTLDLKEMTVTDHQLKILNIQIGGKQKKIHAYYSYPKRLDWFYHLILELSGVEDWIGCDD